MMRLASLLVLAALFAFVAGCGPKGPVMVPVSGVVKLDGMPVADAGVLFMPTNGGNPAQGNTDKEGKFSLTTTKPNDGAIEGEYLVAVTGVRTTGVTANADGTSGDATNMRQEWFVPQKYAKPTSSGLTQKVSKGMPAVELNLSAK